MIIIFHVSFISFILSLKAFERLNMSNHLLKIPTNQDIEQAREGSRKLSKYISADRVNLSISGSNGESDNFVLPGIVMQMLLDILSDMSQGNAVNIIPYKAELSTQQAADLLNVSRPYLVKLLEKGDLPFHKIGTHRRVLVKDVIDYKEQIDNARYDSLDELVQLSQDKDMGY